MVRIAHLVQDYQDWIERKHKDGWTIWFCTLHYNHLRRARAGTIETMQNEVQRIYGRLLTNIIRNPRKAENDELPILIGTPDKPVSKHKPATMLVEMLPNNGMHYHFVLLVPPNNRLKMPLNQHVIQNMQVYLGNQHKVWKFDVQLFVPVPEKSIADYLLKHIKRKTFTSDDILVLPRSRSELIDPIRASREHPAPDALCISTAARSNRR